METQSEVLMEVVVDSAEEVRSGAEGDHVAEKGDNFPCKKLVLVAMMEQEAVLTEKSAIAMKDDQVEITKCTAKLHSLPAVGDGGGYGYGNGEASGADKNGTSQAEIGELPCKEVVAQELVVAKEGGGCNGNGNGDGDGEVPVSNESFLPEFLPVSEDNEPAWGDVPDDIPEKPILSPRPHQRPRVAPECVEVDDVVQTMRNILFNLTYADDAHLNPEDEAKVRDLLKYHPKAEEKTGSGIDFIKIKRHSTFKDVRCFWVVRTDGTETDFSYHKCLKGKVARENPSFLDRYDAIYRAPKRPRMV